MALPTFNEKQSGAIPVKFYDLAGNLVVPTSVVYRVDDADTLTELKADDSSLTPASSMNLPVAKGVNVLVGTADYETHLLTVLAILSPTEQATDQYLFRVKRMRKLPAVA